MNARLGHAVIPPCRRCIAEGGSGCTVNWRDTLLKCEDRVCDRKLKPETDAELCVGDNRCDRAPLRHRLEVDHLLPVLAPVENDGDLLRELVRLRKRQNLEQLVARAETAREYHQRFGQIREPELPHEEVVELEMQAFSDV